ncbi:MAG: helix-turn-helix transcriptional regulator [Bdellovibrionota bacterium]
MSKMTLPMISSLLLDGRLNKGLRESEVASFLGVSVATLREFESAERTPTLSQVKKLAGLYQLNMETVVKALHFDSAETLLRDVPIKER